MGTIKVGFFNLKFIITPKEFNQIIEDENCFFVERCPSPILVEKRNLKEILKDYEIFYNRVMTNEKFENSKDIGQNLYNLCYENKIDIIVANFFITFFLFRCLKIRLKKPNR